ncbi:MFS transporter [Bradyrhizobium prioriisuperbiae]|uniref:MFS transporter n=1 Tax=Bradyrhizobium prioriisuperbiae TaxID=2854389 RepID=UPI0028EF652F|nr:MFS transporter [Bradyrhizobium prioritasuperba]
MLSVLANRTYRHLFAAQVIALIGTGMMTVALGLLAFRIAGAKAGAVLGTALAIKMIAYVGVAPVVSGFANYLPRRAFLVSMDLTRAAIAVALPFVNQVWQVYVLIFVLQSASAAFTPTFQATIPDVLPDEGDYTRALSLSRLAYDMESLLSPTLAAALLTLISFNWLFFGTVIGFFCSAALVLSVTIPQPPAADRMGGIYENTTRGLRIYLATPRLRGLLALNLSVAAAGAMVIVNTVVVVRGLLGGTDSNVAIALACFGGGSMAAALLLPRMLERISDRAVILPAAAALGVTLLCLASVIAVLGWGPSGSNLVWGALLLTWALLGICYSAVMTPSGRLLRRSAQPADRPAVFAAQFALSHGCWLLTYPLAGWLAIAAGVPATLLVLATIAFAGAALATRLWPRESSDVIQHHHPELPSDHPHMRGQPAAHAHSFVIDDLHPKWP